jgi:hypothetical protein
MANPVKQFFAKEYDETNPGVSGKNYGPYILVCLLGVIIYVVYYRFCYNMIGLETYNDLQEHTQMASRISLNPQDLWNAWLQTPYLGWFLTMKVFMRLSHMNAAMAASNACAFYALLCYGVICFLGNRAMACYLKVKEHVIASASLAFALAFAWPLFCPALFPDQYLGQFAINPFHNATQMSVKWIALLCVAMAVDLFRIEYGKEAVFFTGRAFKKAGFVFFSVALLGSVLYKPTFAFVFLPAGLILLITEWIRLMIAGKKDGKIVGKLLLKLLLAVLPAVVYILLEYIAFYFWGDNNGDSRVALAAPFTAWRIYSNNIFMSVIVGMAFPLWMVITNPKYFFRSLEGKLSVICFLVGFAEFALIVETDYRLEHLNFAWEYMSGMLVIYLIAGLKLLVETYKGEGKLSKFRVIVGWGLLFAHMFSGFICINPASYIL